MVAVALMPEQVAWNCTRVILILLAGIALAQLHTSTALQLYEALCGAGALWR